MNGRISEHRNHRRSEATRFYVSAPGHYTVAYFDDGDRFGADHYATWLRGLGYAPLVVDLYVAAADRILYGI